MKINRLLAIVTILLNRDKVSAAELAEKFEVSIRTIYRDIEAINMSNIPIVSQAGNGGGFSIMSNYKINHQFLTFEDMVSISEALKNMNEFLQDKSIDKTFEKIVSIVPENKRTIFNSHFQQIAIDNLPWGFKKSKAEDLKYKTIYEAMESKNCISFSYRNAKNEISTRAIEPLTLVFKSFSWYIFSFCTLRNDYRYFKLSRMNNLNVLDNKIQDNRMSYEEYKNASSENNCNKLTKIKLKFSDDVRYRVEDCFDEEQIKYQDDKSMIVETYLYEDEWVYSMILSYGEHVEVLEPQHLRKIIIGRAENILNKYSNLT